MGLFDRFSRKNKEEKTNIPLGAGARNRLFSPKADCFENSAFWSCITLLCQKYATLPFTPHEEGSYRAMGRSRALYRLIENPNPWMRQYDFMYVMGINFELHGQAIAVIERASNGIPIGLYPVSPSSVYARWDDNDIIYTVSGDNGSATYKREDLLIINNTPSGYTSVLSPLQFAESGLELSEKAKQLQADYYEGGSVLGKIIKTPERTYQAQKETIKAIFDSSRKYRNIILPDSVSVEPIKADGESISKLIEAQSWDVLEVSRRFHVPKSYLGDTSGGYGNMEQQALQLISECLQPRCKCWEMAWNADVCDDNEYVKFDLQSLMRGDHATRQGWYTQMLTHGVYSINEVRAFEDLEPIGKEGDVHYFQAGFANVKDIETGAFTKTGVGADAPQNKEEENTRSKNVLTLKTALESTENRDDLSPLLRKIAEEIGVKDKAWLGSYITEFNKRNTSSGQEAYRTVNAFIVKKCNENCQKYTVEGLEPTQGYFEFEGKKYRNPPFYEGDTRLVSEVMA